MLFLLLFSIARILYGKGVRERNEKEWIINISLMRDLKGRYAPSKTLRSERAILLDEV